MNRLQKAAFAAATVTLSSLAMAQANPAPAAQGLRGFISAAYTNGGEKLASVSYADGKSGEISAGGTYLLRVGAEFPVHDKLSI